MSASATNYSLDVDCVLISDEDEDEVPTKVSASVKSSGTPSIDIKNYSDPSDRTLNAALDDHDGRRVSRRRKTKIEPTETGKSIDATRSSSEQVNENSTKSHSNSQANTNIPYTDKKYVNNENRAETRSRKREASPVMVDVKEVDPIPYKEILSGLEGAAFQSR